MDKLKQWVALTVVAALSILAAGWFLLISPKRSDAADLRTRAAAQQSTNAGLEAKLATLRSQTAGLPQQQATLAAVAAKVPDNPALPGLVRALSAAASDAGVELVSLAPAPPTAVVTLATTPTKVVSGTAKPTAGATSSTTNASAAVGAALTGTLEQIPVAINVIGGYYQVEQFFDRVEHLSRAMKVTGFALAPGVSPVKPSSATGSAAPATLTATINTLVYMSSGRVTAPTTSTPIAAK